MYRKKRGAYSDGERRPPGIPGVDSRILLKWISKKWDMSAWTG